ncbi:MAG: hypothetical protein HQL36_10480 [Alphaproteobacteria bacterium]|nr:hypothetical protein [Alphaproteobacteria bacterium]MBF0250510.1 hypothetical protein [Alphaproteobacteria bacterium]
MTPSARILTALTVFTLFAGVAPPAHAYVDPGTGGFLLQIILGGVAGAMVVLKLYWQRFLALFGRAQPEPADDGDAPDRD